MVLANYESYLQWAVHKLSYDAEEWSLQILISRTMIMAFRGKNSLRSIKVINNSGIEHVIITILATCSAYLNHLDLITLTVLGEQYKL